MRKVALGFLLAVGLACPARAARVNPTVQIVQRTPPVTAGTVPPPSSPAKEKPPIREVTRWAVKWLEKPAYTWIETFLSGRGVFYQGGACPAPGQCADGKAGVFGSDGRVLFKAEYERIRSLHGKGFVMVVNKKIGFMTWDGKVLIPAKYTNLHLLDNGFFAAMLPGQSDYVILSPDGREILRGAEDTQTVNETAIWVLRREKWGVFDRDGKTLMPHRYQEVTWVGDKSIAARVGKRWALFDGAGKQLTPLKYSAFDYGSGGVLIFNLGGRCEGGISECEGGKFGVLGEDGKVVLPAAYDCVELYDFGENDVEIRAVSHPPNAPSDPANRCHGGKWQHFRKDGTPVFVETFAYLDPLEDKKFARAVKKGICDTTGNCESGKWGVLDRTGKVVLNYQYDWIAVPGEKATAFVDGAKWGLLDAAFTVKVPASLEMIHVDPDAVRFLSKGKWGVMDFTGQVLVPAKYDAILPFSEGSARFLEGGKWGLLSAAGKILVPATQLAICASKMKTYLFATAGKCTVRWGRDAPDPLRTIAGVSTRLTGTAGADCECVNGTFGLMSAAGKTLLPAKYQSIQVQSSMLITEQKPPGGGMSATSIAMPPGQVWVRLNQGGVCPRPFQCAGGRWGLADLAGRLVIPVENAYVEPQIDYLVRVAKGTSCDVNYWRVNRCSTDTKWGLMKLEPQN